MSNFDIIIIGGGIAGASLGALLAGKCRVAILEAEEHCAFHSTGRSAAFWLASYGGPGVIPLTLASKPFFDSGWPGVEAQRVPALPDHVPNRGHCGKPHGRQHGEHRQQHAAGNPRGIAGWRCRNSLSRPPCMSHGAAHASLLPAASPPVIVLFFYPVDDFLGAKRLTVRGRQLFRRVSYR